MEICDLEEKRADPLDTIRMQKNTIVLTLAMIRRRRRKKELITKNKIKGATTSCYSRDAVATLNLLEPL
ncbi:hypothetical protein Tco_1209914 [Tanacetum coccineum]